MAATRREDDRSCRADADRAQRSEPGARQRRMVDRAPHAGPQAARRSAIPRTPISSCATPTPPDRNGYRSEHQFMAGWIALRFLHDPATAHAHFAKIGEDAENPISLARGAYWRAAQPRRCARPGGPAHTRRRRAIRPPITARSPGPRQGSASHPQSLPRLPSAEPKADVVRANRIALRRRGPRPLPAMMADLGDKSTDMATLAAVGD